MSTTVSIILYALAVFFAAVTGSVVHDKDTGKAKFGLVITTILFVAAGALQVAA